MPRRIADINSYANELTSIDDCVFWVTDVMSSTITSYTVAFVIEWDYTTVNYTITTADPKVNRVFIDLWDDDIEFDVDKSLSEEAVANKVCFKFLDWYFTFDD